MPLSFHKMHANGDDFVVVDSRNGGTVTVQWDGVGPVFLIGPVETTFSGMFMESLLHGL